MRAVMLSVAVAFSLAGSPALAQYDKGRIELAASAGYGAPVGEAERGARVSDTAFGAIPFTLDAAYCVTPFVGVAVHARYGIAIPTLCQSASDCEASLGRDTALTLSARFYAPRAWRLSPFLDVGIGYEWLTTQLVDAGATSTRSYGGPVVLAAQLAVPVRFGARWTLGPTLGAWIGTFTTYALHTNAQSPSGDVPWRAVHAWISPGVRLGFSL
jgi:hypothetical protein